MINQEVALRPQEYTSNNSIRNSEKVIAYPANYHLKTEQQDRNEDQHKSPQQGKIQFRETSWRKPRMPYNKFPDAFQMRNKGKSIDRGDDYQKLKKEKQFEQVKKYLNPISLQKRQEKPKQQETSNPLAAYKRYLEMQKKYTKEFQDDDPFRRSKVLSFKKNTSTLQINDCITLDVIKRGHNTGTIKKMLHVPTLQLVCVRQQPTNTRESRNSIKQWVGFWQGKLNRQQKLPFMQVHSVAYNYPQGAISIVIDYFEEGSLLDLLQVVLTLPESVIRQVFQQVLIILRTYYELTQMQFGGLSPSQILITNDGQIKLGMGLYYHFTNSTSNSIYHIKIPQKTNIFEMNMTQKNFMKSSIVQPVNLQLERSLDVFKLGLIMLECAIGGFQNYQQSDSIHQILRIVFSQQGQKTIERDNVCCLIHSQLYLIEWGNRQQRLRREQIDCNKIILYMKYIKDRFSVQFINFLCSCLKLLHTRRATITELMMHSFLRSQGKDNRTVGLGLKDLMLVRRSEPDPIIQSSRQERLDKFIGHVMSIMNERPKEEVAALVRSSREKILGIGKYIGVNYYGLGQKLLSAMVDLSKRT